MTERAPRVVGKAWGLRSGDLQAACSFGFSVPDRQAREEHRRFAEAFLYD